MKYLISTLKYVKSNAVLWIAYAVAALCVSTIVDVGALHKVIDSFTGGISDAGLTEWVLLFLPVNTHSWWSVLFSIVGYVVLALDLSLICASTDRHMRYNSLSARGLFSSINNNLLPCAFTILFLLVVSCVLSVVLAAIMKAICFSSVAYMFILGLVLCAAAAIVAFYVLTFFSLWLPCFTITGFRAFESLSYAYSLGANKRIPLFLAIFIPTVIIGVCSLIAAIFAPDYAAIIIIALLVGLLAVYIPVLCYTVYIDADGITREDLKKF